MEADSSYIVQTRKKNMTEKIKAMGKSQKELEKLEEDRRRWRCCIYGQQLSWVKTKEDMRKTQKRSKVKVGNYFAVLLKGYINTKKKKKKKDKKALPGSHNIPWVMFAHDGYCKSPFL